MEVHDEDSDVQLTDAHATACRSLAARAGHHALDGPDIQFVCNEIGSAMAKPSERHWTMLRRVAEHLKGKPRLVHTYWKERGDRRVNAYIHANWAGNRTTRRSTSGCIVLFINHWIKLWSKSKSLAAESELYMI